MLLFFYAFDIRDIHLLQALIIFEHASKRFWYLPKNSKAIVFSWNKVSFYLIISVEEVVHEWNSYRSNISFPLNFILSQPSLNRLINVKLSFSWIIVSLADH